MGITAELTGEPQLAKEAEGYAREGLTLMNLEEMFPEKGAGDASYQGVLQALDLACFEYLYMDKKLIFTS